ncbi:MAG: hypothetical protein RIQ33_2404 [Bacteroidota bacterium]|jgi:hypothetical protein
MKHVIIFLVGSIILFSACASEMKSNAKEIPTAVIDSFKIRFPDVYLPDWSAKDKKNKIIYIAKWQSVSKKHKAKFLENGTLIKTK